MFAPSQAAADRFARQMKDWKEMSSGTAPSGGKYLRMQQVFEIEQAMQGYSVEVKKMSGGDTDGDGCFAAQLSGIPVALCKAATAALRAGQLQPAEVPAFLGMTTERRFKFFGSSSEEGPATPAHVSCTAAADDGCLWLGCADGTVLSVGSDLAALCSFQAHQGSVRAIEWTKGKLLTVGEDGEGLRNLNLKAWAVEGLRPAATPAALALPCRLMPAAPKPSASAAAGAAAGAGGEGSLSAVALHCTEWPVVSVALGLSQGTVHILRADVVKGKATAPVPAAQLRDAGGGGTGGGSGGRSSSGSGGGGGGGISALHFASAAPPSSGRRGGGGRAGTPPAATTSSSSSSVPAGSSGDLHLFVVGAARLAAFDVKTGHGLLEDECGAPPGCTAVSQRGELLVAGPEAVYFYTAEEGRKAAYSLRGEKLAVAAARHYLVAVLAEEGGGASSGGQGAVAQVLDLQNKVVAASVPLEPPVRWMAAHVGGRCIDIGDAGGGVVRLVEKPFEEKLEALYKSRSYQLAVAVAETEQADAATLAGIHRQYGDFLYAKRDYDQAMEQYGATVGFLEPSYVIQRYLDVQRIHSLTDYLERLHAQGAASCDHTTLLLNCYTKLKDVAKLDAFIQGDGRMSRDALHFDVDTAIKVCRSAGYYEHALYVALAAGEPQTYLDILLEDCQRYGEGLEYIRGLPRQEAAAALQKYGKALLGAVPVETTALLMGLCLRDPSDPSAFVANMADFTHLYADRPEDLQYACVTILNMSPDSPSRQTLYHTLLDLYLSPPDGSSGSAAAAGGAAAGGAAAAAAEGKAAEKRAEGNNQERAAGAGAGQAAGPAGGQQQQTQTQKAAGNAAGKAGGSSSSQQEALDLLKRGWPAGEEPAYDVDYALLACRMHSFWPGLLFLYENLRLYRELAGVLMESGDRRGLISACQRFGDPRTGGDPQLWHDALEYFAGQTDDCSAQVRELLSRIEAGGILPPLVVLQILSRNPAFRLSLVKDYVTRQLQADSRSIRGDQEEAERLKLEIEKTRQQVERLQTEPVVFQSSRDSQTHAPLELPSVHFLCGHSFNLRTLGDGDAACPLCAAEHRKAQELRRSNRASAADKDAFFKQLRAAPDGFSLVAKFFGKGMLSNTSVTTPG